VTYHKPQPNEALQKLVPVRNCSKQACKAKLQSAKKNKSLEPSEQTQKHDKQSPEGSVHVKQDLKQVEDSPQDNQNKQDLQQSVNSTQKKYVL
jgi:hypothetical protein